MVLADPAATTLNGESSLARRIIVDVVLAAVALAYFAGFLVDFYYLAGLGLSMAATSVPVFYLFVYSFSIFLYSILYVCGMVVVAVATAAIAEILRRQRIAKSGEAADFMTHTFYPSLVITFMCWIAFLVPACQAAAHGQLANLALPHRSLLSVRLTSAFLKDHAHDPEVRRFQQASDNGGLVLAADLKDELVYVERYPPGVEGTPAIHYYRLNKSAIALSFGSVFP